MNWVSGSGVLLSSFTGMVALALLTAGCAKDNSAVANGDDPLAALTVPVPSDRYNSSFWTQKSRADTALWTQAVAYCEGKTDGDHPNCAPVRQVRVLERMAQPPAPSQDNFSLRAHQDTQAHGNKQP